MHKMSHIEYGHIWKSIGTIHDNAKLHDFKTVKYIFQKSRFSIVAILNNMWLLLPIYNMWHLLLVT